jgi:hypothetical protein
VWKINIRNIDDLFEVGLSLEFFFFLHFLFLHCQGRNRGIGIVLSLFVFVFFLLTGLFHGFSHSIKDLSKVEGVD